MKRYFSLFLAAALVLLCSCGDVPGQTASPVSSGEASVVTETSGGYIVPSFWRETSMDDGTFGYVTAELSLPQDGEYTIDGGYLTAVTQTSNTVDDSFTLLRLNFDGTEHDRVSIPATADGENISQSLSHVCYAHDGVWLVRYTYTVTDQETGETAVNMELEKWSAAGENLYSVMLDRTFGLGSEDSVFISDLCLSPEGCPVLATTEGVYFCDETGAATGLLESDLAPFLRFVSDSTGRVYIHNAAENTLSAVDWENQRLGETVLTLNGNESIFPGGGPYDLLLSSETTLSGVCFSNTTVTTILTWADWDLAGLVGSVGCMEDGTFLVSAHDLLTELSQLLTLTRCPADDIPEKTVVTLAVPLSQRDMERGGNWTETLGEMAANQMSAFNRGNDTYRVEVVTYSSGEELQLMLLSGDAPDIILWSYMAWLDEPPAMALYAKKGYLADLEPLFEADDELSLDDFLPNIVEVCRERSGGLYAMPTEFYLSFITASRDYVSDGIRWSFGDILATARTLPEDMGLWGYTPRSEMLETFLQTSMELFVDLDTMTCSFETQEFYDLLTLCRDYFPAELDEQYSLPAGGTMLAGDAVMSSFGQFAADTLQTMETNGKTFASYPGDTGNGFTMIFINDYSICSLGDQQEGAWEFLRTLYTYEFQLINGRSFSSVRMDTFNAREDRYLVLNGSCTEEESMAARQLAYGAKSIRDFSSPLVPIVLEEAAAFFAGDKTAEETARIIQSRAEIFLGEQS